MRIQYKNQLDGLHTNMSRSHVHFMSTPAWINLVELIVDKLSHDVKPIRESVIWNLK